MAAAKAWRCCLTELELTSGKFGKTRKLDVTIKGRPYIDTVVELDGIVLYKGDTLAVSFHTSIELSIDDHCTDFFTESFRYLYEHKKRKTIIKFVRFTKMGELAHIEVSAKMPAGNLHIPRWNAAPII